ncbi:antibiotic biosynthesis monooxygenase [Candidatus Methylomirabilis lanthanidiphila]|uniref:Antibiotic biosynthesis monooxygenase n=1 Tax=Candidatus Methylomirabilis lanthanidiphila TaxID=2211376 RepID=A0A564ZK80_9BACT|nr:antibiotic biosynthesis monooxygenase [Candidatus Methylomirabilis lanthanidiphila]VUZ85267.1 antibiotic biosynthesis monooxygenase [Candidatus Methylomirabilis lanthanidiphila]
MTDQGVRVVARVVARPGKVEELRAVLQGLVEPTRKELGCVTYELLQNKTDPTDFTFVEEWTSEAALDAHLQSPHLQDARVKLPGLAVADPDIRRYTVVE